jgi:hypothetical protein
MTTREPLASLLGRLRHATGSELTETLQKIVGSDYSAPDKGISEEFLDTPGALDQVAQIVETRIDEGAYVFHSSLAYLIVKTGSSHLYEKYSELLTGHSILLILYRGQYPDPKIQEMLCNSLYKIAQEPDPWRTIIVQAMHEVGSKEVLPTLEAIYFTLEPRAKVSEVFAEQLGFAGPFIATAQMTFTELVENTIKNIKIREASADYTVASGIPEVSAIKEMAAHQNEDDGQYLTAKQLIEDGENDSVEFKSTFQWDLKENRKNDDIIRSSLKTIAAFLNTNGGYLLIGVEDNKNPIGIEVDDIGSDEDKFFRHVRGIIRNKLGAHISYLLKEKIELYEGKSVYIIRCKPSPTPVYLKMKNSSTAEFFIRNGPATELLQPADEFAKYIFDRFPRRT